MNKSHRSFRRTRKMRGLIRIELVDRQQVPLNAGAITKKIRTKGEVELREKSTFDSHVTF